MFPFPRVLSTILVAPLLAAVAATPAPTTGIEWKYGSLDDAIASSSQKSGLTLVYFWADGSDYCGKLYQETLTTDAAAEAVDGMVCYSAKHSGETAELFERYKVRALPTLLVVRADGELEDIMTGFVPVDDFVREIARIRRAEGTRSGIAAELEKLDPSSKGGIEARWLLVGKLQELGLTELEEQHTQKILELDPNGQTEPGGQLVLNELITAALGDLSDKSDEEAEIAFRDANLEPVYAFAKGSKCQPVRFAAWSALARFEARREDYAAAREAIARTVADVADESRAGWCNAVAGWAVLNAERLSSKERKYAQNLSEKAVKLTMAARKKSSEDKQTDGDGYELSDDALAQRMCVLAQVEFMNRQRDRARKTIAKAAELAQGETIVKEIAEVQHRIDTEK